MPHDGYANPIMNDEPEFHSNMPDSKLTERVTQAIEASDVSSTPLVAETTDGVTHETRPTPWPRLTLGLALHLAQTLARARHFGFALRLVRRQPTILHPPGALVKRV